MNRPTIGKRRAVARALRLALIVFLPAFLPAGCGKKGPPLPPLVRLPARPDPFAARRLGSTVYLQVRIPTVNSDNTSPASIERVEIYGFTGSPEGNEDIFKSGMLVASIPVRKPPEDQESRPPEKDAAQKPVKPEDRPPAPPRPPPSMENGFDQGDTIVVTEPLGPEQLAPVVVKKKKAPKLVEPAVPEGPRALGPAPRAALPSRIYVAVGVNRKGQKGAASARQTVLLLAPASAPGQPEVKYVETSLTIAWTPPADAFPPAALGSAPAAAATTAGTAAGAGGTPPADASPPVLRSTPIGTLQISGAFNVYEVPAPVASPAGTTVPLPPVAGGLLPAPVNDKPVPAPPFVDNRMEFGRTRCYAVRAVTLFGAQPVEGEASPPQCVTPADTFAPAAPVSLKAVGSEGAISLVWDANTEADLAGYIVLRAEMPGREFKPVTTEPVKEPTFNDTTAAKGVRYAYVIVAVDKAGNHSLTSNQVEESAR